MEMCPLQCFGIYTDCEDTEAADEFINSELDFAQCMKYVLLAAFMESWKCRDYSRSKDSSRMWPTHEITTKG